MIEPTPDSVDILAVLEARIEDHETPRQVDRAELLRRFEAELASTSVVQALRRELSLVTQRVHASAVAAGEPPRLKRLQDVAAKLGMMAFIAKLPIVADEFMAIMRAAADLRRPWRDPDAPDPDRVVGVMDDKGNYIDFPTRPGPFTIGGPGCDVVVPGLVGVKANGEVLPNGRVRITEPGATPSQAERNDPCPCGSGRKFKRCCLN
jgi:hypothetical protein